MLQKLNVKIYCRNLGSSAMYVWGIYLKSTCPFICLFIYKKEKNNKFYQGIDISIITSIFSIS